MVRLPKQSLLDRAVAAIEADGWTVDPLTQAGEHPARYKISQDGVEHIVRLYIWNLSHGGKSRSASEYRIQVTGIDQFEPEPDGRTLILGWSDDFGVFAGFDVQHRTGRLGSSPSIQITTTTLTAGEGQGAALQDKKKGEWAIAFRPDKLGQYIQHHSAAHGGDLAPILADDNSLAADPLASEILFYANQAEAFDTQAPGPELQDQILADIDKILETLLTDAGEGEPAPIGHNNPPGPIDDEASLAARIEEAAGEIKAELEAAEPNARKIGRAGALLALAGRILKSVGTESGKIWDKTKEKAREHIAAALWGLGGSVGVNFVTDVVDWLRSVGSSILHWLQHAAIF